MKVAVVILNWNGKNFLEKFLPSVIQFNSINAQIIVADNASTDDSVNFLKLNYPQIKIIINTTNGGFAKGYNEALKDLKYEYFVLLNSDVEVTPFWMDPIIKLMDQDVNIAACQPKILKHTPSFTAAIKPSSDLILSETGNENEQQAELFNTGIPDTSKTDQIYFEYAGAAGGFIDKYGYPFCRGRILNNIEVDKGQYNDTCEIFWATGACLFIRAEYFHRLQGFDEDFFAHMEEIDLCWRLKNMGYKIIYCGESKVFHVGAATLKKTNSFKTFLNFRNNLILIFKNHPSQFFYYKLLIRFLLDGIAGLYFLLTGEFNHCIAIIKAHFSFYFSFGKTLKKRKQLKLNVNKYTTTAVYKKSIIVDYYIRNKKTFKEIYSTDPLL